MKPLLSIALALAALFSVSCETLQTNAKPQAAPTPAYQNTGVVYHGKASWYSVKTNGGYATASGERFNEWADTAAHKTLPLGTRVKVTNLNNGMNKVVRINDRGPYITGRIIDVSLGVAHDLDFVNRGVVPVTVEIVKKTAVPSTPPKPEAKSLFTRSTPKSAKPGTSRLNQSKTSGSRELPKLDDAFEKMAKALQGSASHRSGSPGKRSKDLQLRARLGEFGKALKDQVVEHKAKNGHRSQKSKGTNRSGGAGYGLRSVLHRRK
ncbi:MAG: septal ring lytic transglycosylase RlpA family protein [Verrucomicrobiota bacterium]